MAEPIHLQHRSFYARYGPRLMLLLGLLLPVVIWGAKQAGDSNNNNIKQWLPQGLPETATYREFRGHFGTDEFAIVSWDGCTLNDPRLELFADEVIRSGPLLFASVTTGPRMVGDLLEAHDDITREEAIGRLQGLLIGRQPVGVDEYGDDDFTTCALVKLAPAGDDDRTSAVKALEQAAQKIGLDLQHVYLGGDTVSNAALDTESERAINSLTGFAVLVALVMALVGLRSVRMTIFVFLVAGYSAALAQALVYFTGGQLNLVLVVMPVLVFVLAISSSIHVINYYRDAQQRVGIARAASQAIVEGWLPCTLAAATTAVGLISLSVSRVEPVQRFGQYGALGIIASLAFVFVLLPSLLELRRKNGPSDATPASRENPFIQALVTAILRHHRILVVACAATLVVFGYGLGKINTSVKPMRFYAADSKVMVDARWFEQHLGPLVPIEVVIEFDNAENDDTFFQRLFFVSQVSGQIHAMDDVGATISAATFAPPSTVASGGNDADGAASRLAGSLGAVFGINARRIMEKRLRRLFIENKYLAEVTDDDGRVKKELWRITARVEAVNDIEYDEFLDEIREQVGLPESGRNISQNEHPGVHAAYTGAVPLVYVAQNELLTGLRNSFLMAFGLIGLVMVVLLRSVAAGLISMLPNIFPAVIIFGAMGWLGTVVDVGSMLTASVAMGIAVDDTLHFLTWFRRAVRAGLSRSDAIVRAYQRCAVAMTQTTAIAGLGLLVYSQSSFQPVSQFGLLMCLLLVMALIGDLVFLPALLAGRMGALFEHRLRGDAPEQRESEETVAEIEQATSDMEAGRGTPLEQVKREMRDEFGVSEPE